MNYIDIIFIIVTLIGIYVGYNGGFYKIMSDVVIFFVASYISSLLTNLLFDKVITYLPFFNFWGASEGIKSINIIVWKVILYVLLIVILSLIINKILAKTGIQEKLDEKIITMRKWGRYLGCLFVIPFMMVLLFNVVLVLGMPIFNMSSIHESSISKFLTNNMILIKNTTKSLHDSEKYAIKLINDGNTIETYSSINDDILDYLENKELISSESIEKLKSDKKLTGTKTKNIENKDNNSNDKSNNNSNNNNNNNNNNSNNNNSNNNSTDDDVDNDNYEEYYDESNNEEYEEFDEENYYDEDSEVL